MGSLLIFKAVVITSTLYIGSLVVLLGVSVAVDIRVGVGAPVNTLALVLTAVCGSFVVRVGVMWVLVGMLVNRPAAVDVGLANRLPTDLPKLFPTVFICWGKIK